MTPTTRRLTAEDAETARRLGWEAFGFPASPSTDPARVDQPGMTWFGSFEGDTLVARMVDRAYDSCFGGALVPTSGIAGVTVAVESRGRGALSPLVAATLGHARERGAAISTLFPTAPGIYRRFGYELVADFVTVQLPTVDLAAVAPTTSTTTRRATSVDREAVHRVYERWALAQNGPLWRRGISFDTADEGWPGAWTGVTVAEEDGEVTGYAAWNRGQGYDDTAVLEITDLLASTADGYRALLRMLGSFAPVAPTTRIDTSGDDLARFVLPSVRWRVQDSSPYMLRVVDVPGALAARGYAPSLDLELHFSLQGDVLPGLDGGYRLAVAGGRGECVPAGASDRVLSPQGLALLYAGAQSSANLRVAGHLRGGDPRQDLDWDALFGGRQLHIRNYF